MLNYYTVHYLNWEDLRRALDCDIEQESGFSYKNIFSGELVAHVTRFVWMTTMTIYFLRTDGANPQIGHGC